MIRGKSYGSTESHTTAKQGCAHMRKRERTCDSLCPAACAGQSMTAQLRYIKYGLAIHFCGVEGPGLG
jgi:hypothetical protein